MYLNKLMAVCFLVIFLAGCGAADNPTMEIVSYNIQVESSNANFGTVTGGGVYEANQVVTLSAHPSDGYEFVKWTQNGLDSAYETEFSITINDNNSFEAHFLKTFTCADSLGDEREFSYYWSLDTEKVTIQNNNVCDELYIWATSTPLCLSCVNEIKIIKQSIPPSASLELEAGVPYYLSLKPEVIYSLANGDTFSYLQGDFKGYHRETILLDNNEELISQIVEFEPMYAIDSEERVEGDCSYFSWLDRDNGSYHVAPSDNGEPNYCLLQQIYGFTASAERVLLPEIRYFVIDYK